MSNILEIKCCICKEPVQSVYTVFARVSEEEIRVYSGHKRCLPSREVLLESDVCYDVKLG